jgi:hypothetical protein
MRVILFIQDYLNNKNFKMKKFINRNHKINKIIKSKKKLLFNKMKFIKKFLNKKMVFIILKIWKMIYKTKKFLINI